MLQKIIVAALAFIGNFMIAWYGNFAGKLSSKGAYLGLQYDSIYVRALVTQFEYLWVLVIINVIFTVMFRLGFDSFKNFLALASIWLAMGPISALVFNALVLKEKTSPVAFIGMLLIIAGSILVIANKEIFSFLKS